jgi:hypothetical protein
VTPPVTMQSAAMLRSGDMTPPVTMQSAATLRSGDMIPAGDDAERSDAEERRW